MACCCSSPPYSCSLKKHTYALYPSSNIANPSWPAATTAGNQVAAVLGAIGVDPLTLEITPPAGWTLVSAGAGNNVGVWIYSIPLSPSRNGAETFTLSESVPTVWVELLELNNQGGGLDLAASSSNDNPNPDTGLTAVTNFQREVQIGAIAYSGAQGAFTNPTNGFTIADNIVNLVGPPWYGCVLTK